MKPATIEEVATLAQTTYDSIWEDWYAQMPNATKAMVSTYIGVDSAGYSHPRNLLQNPIGDGNLEDFDIRNVEGWPIWKVQLVHEMLHEWQFKKPCVATAPAVALHAQCLRRNFTGGGHGPEFFQAILEKAPYFGMTPLELFNRI
ncbi:MAG: hypothetical protein PSV13_03115 [Lacunisphaera sp.]|nr:hypothetical protein [Lacunisphaera sp.]